MVYYIIQKQSGISGDYILGNIEGMKEFLNDKETERNRTKDQSDRDFLNRLCQEIQQRITQLERIYKVGVLF